MPPETTPIMSLAIDPAALEPLIRAVVCSTIARLDEARAGLPDRLAYSEQEAARLIGLRVHQLRDERLRGRIGSAKIVGGRIAYTRQDLLEYLTRRRTAAA